MTHLVAPKLPAHIPSLDGLRAISIFLVLIAHAAATSGAPQWLDRPMFTSLGNVGVRFFFVISGFLITTLLLRDIEKYGRIRLKLFYLRRALRILPAAYCFMAVMWLLHAAGVIDLTFHVPSRTHVASALPSLLHAATFTANYAHDYNWYFNHLWTLSVEEQFYLLWPFTIFLFGLRRATVVGCTILLAVPLLRLVTYEFGTGPEIALSREFHAVADALATGCLGTIFFNWLTNNAIFASLARAPAIPLGGALVALGYGAAFVSRPAAYVFGQTAANLGVLLILQHVVRYPDLWAGRLLNSRPLVGIGVLSYSLYLWQEPFLFFLGTSWATAFPQNIVFAIGAASVSYYVVERPALRLKDRLSTSARPARGGSSGGYT